MFVGEVFNGMVGYLSFCLRLLKVDQEALPTKVSPPKIYPNKTKDNSLRVVTDTTPSGFIARHIGSFRYSFIRFVKKKRIDKIFSSVIPRL